MSAATGKRRRSGVPAVARAFIATLVLLTFTLARARPPASELLPPLAGAVLVTAPVPASAGFGWQLHQSLSFQPDTWQGRLELQPSFSLNLHDPEAAPRQAMEALTRELQAAEQRQHQGLAAHSTHTDFLLFQHQLHVESLLLDWLQSATMLPPAPDQPGWRPEFELAEVALLLQETRNELQLLFMRLSAAGVSAGEVDGLPSRPRPQLGSNPLAACLTGNPEIRRLGLMRDYQLLEAELAASASRLKVDLEAGFTVGLGAVPSAGWNLGLTVARADHRGGRLQLNVTPQLLAQSFTIRGPESADSWSDPADADTGIAAAIDSRAQHLRGLLLAREQAEAREGHARMLVDAELSLLHESTLSGQMHQGLLAPAYRSLIALSQTALHHDQLRLQLALECGTEPGYVQVDNYP